MTVQVNACTFPLLVHHTKKMKSDHIFKAWFMHDARHWNDDAAAITSCPVGACNPETIRSKHTHVRTTFSRIYYILYGSQYIHAYVTVELP